MLSAKFAQLVRGELRARREGGQGCCDPQAHRNLKHFKEEYQADIFQFLPPSYCEVHGVYSRSLAKVHLRR